MKKILFVDDDPNILAALQRQLRKQYEVETAIGPNEGLAALGGGGGFSVVVADMRMPDMNGVEFLAIVKEAAPDVVRMMLTGNADQATAIDAINRGNIFRFLNKPCASQDLIAALDAGIRQHQLITAERELLEKTLAGSIKALTEILSLVESNSFGNTRLLRERIRRLAQHLNYEPPWELEVAASLAQIGRVTIPPEVLLKLRVNHALSPKEQDMLLRVPAVGANLVAQIPRLEGVARIILYQNKRHDGSGFPDDPLAWNEIPLGARIYKTLHDLSQLEAEGIVRPAALERMRQRTGWYDRQILDAIAECFEIAAQTSAPDAKPPIAVAFSGLRIGDVLVSDLETRDGILIVARGNEITQALMLRLRNFWALSGIKEPIHVEQWASLQTERAFNNTPATIGKSG